MVCSATKGIDYGTARRIDGPRFTSATNYAEWTCDTDPGNSANFTFTLPAVMIKSAGDVLHGAADVREPVGARGCERGHVRPERRPRQRHRDVRACRDPARLSAPDHRSG